MAPTSAINDHRLRGEQKKFRPIGDRPNRRRQECLRLLDDVSQRCWPIIVAKRGKPVAELVPLDEEPIDLFGLMAGTIRICGDIIGVDLALGGWAAGLAGSDRPGQACEHMAR
jgi:antitoxin (DNA-binding transcriptional repressor) of toxin-antitoxin stability system